MNKLKSPPMTSGSLSELQTGGLATTKEDGNAVSQDLRVKDSGNVAPLPSIFRSPYMTGISVLPKSFGKDMPQTAIMSRCILNEHGSSANDLAVSKASVPQAFQDVSMVWSDWRQERQKRSQVGNPESDDDLGKSALSQCQLKYGNGETITDEDTSHALQFLGQLQDIHPSLRSVSVFQASPLACKLKNGGVTQRIEEINLQTEREVLSKIFREHWSNVSIAFQIATIETVGDFFREHCSHDDRPFQRSRASPALHLSCHGEKTYLALEDGKGSMQALSLKTLQKWLPNTSIRFVFVAACYSRSIGAMFADSGVDHVICASDDDTEMQSACVLEFCKILYKRLLCGDTVKGAFESASIHIEAFDTSEDPLFCLTGAHRDHKVSLFRKGTPPSSPETLTKPSAASLFEAKSCAPSSQLSPQVFRSSPEPNPVIFPPAYRYNGSSYKKPSSPTEISAVQVGTIGHKSDPPMFTTPPQSVQKKPHPVEMDLETKHAPPVPPEHYVRCDDEKYQILQALNSARIVWISGKEPKCGTSTVVQASLSYLQYRLAPNALDAVLWSSWEAIGSSRSDFTSLVEALRMIPFRRFLVALDAKRLSEETRCELAKQIQCLVDENPLIKVIIIHERKDVESLRVGTYNCNERSVLVGGLNPESTVKLFGKFCPHVTNEVEAGIRGPETLWEVLAPSNAASLRLHGPRRIPTAGIFSLESVPFERIEECSTRFRLLLKLMGGSIPIEIMKTAKLITVNEYQKLLCLGRYTELDEEKYESYNELVKLQLKIAQSFVASIRKKLYDEALSFQLKYDCISIVKHESRNLHALRNELTIIKQQMSRARATNMMEPYSKLFQKRNEAWKRIQNEVDSIVKFSTPFKKNDEEVLDFCCSRQDFLEDLLSYVQDVFVEASIRRCLFSTDNYVESKFVKVEKLLLKAVMGEIWTLDIGKEYSVLPHIEKPSLSTIDEDGEKNDSSSSQDCEESDVEDHSSNVECKSSSNEDGVAIPETTKVPGSKQTPDIEKYEAPKVEPSLSRHSSSRTLATVGTTISGSTSNADRTSVLSDWKSVLSESTIARSSSNSGLCRRSASTLQKTSSNSSSVESMSTTRSSCQTPRSSLCGQNSMNSNTSIPWWTGSTEDGYDVEEARLQDQCNATPPSPIESKMTKSSKNCNPCGKELCSRVCESLHRMSFRPARRKQDRRWQTGASSAPKDLQLPAVRRYSPPPTPREKREVKRNAMVRD